MNEANRNTSAITELEIIGAWTFTIPTTQRSRSSPAARRWKDLLTMSTLRTGAGDAANQPNSIEGKWSSRWNGAADPTISGDAADKWKQGHGEVGIVADRVYFYSNGTRARAKD